ncbi:uncharacterized protein EI90DRAFT_3143585 [Cantharellus anzutake]|uniref:uncharacterized protein n=1 Tax=Cantharellus anzutake TaxID=1750568 RepID=UPI00190462FF|nr:uncharacterized protein EI90DRAFT_3143585 [Cantharellus anzutake]KAF8342045.1 hypothetical protein EI90DRAFT_3143585 [Cantharellus anzutake]
MARRLLASNFARSRGLGTAPSKSFTEKLADGLTLDNFVSSGSRKYVAVSHYIYASSLCYLKTKIPTSASYNNIQKDLRGLNLHTVCEEARCPNIGDCWGGIDAEKKRGATATIMLGDTCTRGCRLCSVKTSKNPSLLDIHEPENTAGVLGTLAPHIRVEALTDDFGGSLDGISTVAESEALTPYVRGRRANFRQSLRVLEHAKKEGVNITKTSIMLGVGENEDQGLDALKELQKSEVDVVTFGQYMRKRHMKVDRYVEPAEFDRWKRIADNSISYKLTLSSRAGEFYIKNILKWKKLDAAKSESSKPSSEMDSNLRPH